MAKTGRAPNKCIPRFVIDFATKHYGSVRAMCLAMNRHENWIKDMFAGEQPHLVPYCRLADYAGISLDVLAKRIEARNTSALIDELLKRLEKENRQGPESLASLSRAIGGISDTLLGQMHRDNGELKGLNNYLCLARKMDIELDLLRKQPEELTSKIAS